MYSHILIATDGSEVATRALEHGLQLAKRLDAKVTIVTVTEPSAVIGAGYATIAGSAFNPVPDLVAAQMKAAQDLLDAANKRAVDAGVAAETELITNDYPAEGIARHADASGCDLIVMGSHGRRGIGRLLLGSQTSNLLSISKLPVLVVR